jgi:stage II sporulation protein D
MRNRRIEPSAASVAFIHGVDSRIMTVFVAAFASKLLFWGKLAGRRPSEWRQIDMKRRLLWLLPVLFVFIFLDACAPLRRPAPGGNIPPIPDQISRGNRQEPVLKVYMHDTQQVKEMPMEEYIAGVVAAEMDPKWPLEALAAQAILARTFTLQKIASQGGVPNRNAHASTDIEEFQAYDASRINDQVRQAVQRTRGEVAVAGGQFIRAWFHANSGGRTATAVEGLAFDKEPTPYVVSIEDSISVQAAPEDQQVWKATFSKDEVKRAVQEVGSRVGDFSRIEIVERGPSGRATKLGIGSAVVSATAFRLAIGSTEMRSTLLEDITVKGNSVTFTGKGYGHGVGMSQWGAKGRADRGEKAETIVQAYYKQISIEKIWD